MKYEIDLERLKTARLKQCQCDISESDDVRCPCLKFCETSFCKCGILKRVD